MCPRGAHGPMVSPMSAFPFAGLDLSAYELPADFEDRLHSPALVIFMDQVRQNLRRMLELTGGPERWRPHLKTTKMPRVWSELLGHGLRHFKCATLREARLFAELIDRLDIRGAELLVAYPLLGPALEGLVRLARKHSGTHFSVLVEDLEAPAFAAQQLGLFIDLNPGMNRTGVPMEDTQRIHALAHAAGTRLGGLHYYDGHLHQADMAARREATFRGYDELIELSQDLISNGLPMRELITSGTPAFQQALAYPGFQSTSGPIHRVSPGTVVFHDLQSELENPELRLVPAACLFSRVISHPHAGCVTLDAGSKSLAAEAGSPVAVALWHPQWSANKPSEEHLPMDLGSSPTPARGSSVLLVPKHVCPTVNLAESALVIDAGKGSIESVEARAHDLFNIN